MVLVEWPAIAGHKATINIIVIDKLIQAHILQEISKFFKFVYGLFNDSII